MSSFPVYSRRLLAGTAAGLPLIAAVPAGKVWVVHVITEVPLAGTGTFALVTIEPGARYIWSFDTAGQVGSEQLMTRHVLEFGEELHAASGSGDPLGYVISGYELSLP